MVICNHYRCCCLHDDITLLHALITTRRIMKNRKKTLLVLTSLTLFLSNVNSFAQCAMCKATATSDLEQGGSIGNGLNTGILYLMAIPYLILMIGGYFFFKKSVDAKVKELKNKFFTSK